MADGVRARFGPRLLVALFAALLVATVLVTPDTDERRGDPRLSIQSATPLGARGLAETLRRLGWQVQRREARYAGTLAVAPESLAVHAVLDPPNALRAAEVHALLDRVRRGGALLAVVARRTALADSLGYAPSERGARLEPSAADTAGCPGRRFREGTLWWPDGMVHTLWLTNADHEPRDERPVPAPAGSVDFVRAHPDRVGAAADGPILNAAARGIALGRGRVVVVADPDLLRNDVLRVCRYGAGMTAVRMAEWLAGAPGAGRRIVFDEFHQSTTSGASPGRFVAQALVATRGGRLVLQLGAAALVLLAAVGARALVPDPRPRLHRRSPLEHVEALANAYTQVGATRLVARRLARGLRRRHGRGVSRASDRHGDAAFLHAVAARHPSLADDVTRLLDAADRAPDRGRPADPRPIADAAAAIDRTLTPRSPAP